jgi:hypothetical protein
MELMGDRLDRLDRQFRRWKWAGIVFGFLIGTPVLLALAAFLTTDGTREAERVVIRDKEGRIRIDIGTWPDGNARLLLIGVGGKPCLELGVGSGDAPMLSLLDREGKSRLHLSVDEFGPALSLRDQGEAARQSLDARSLSLHDSNGKRRMVLLVDDTESTSLSLLDDKEKRRVAVGVSKDGTPRLGVLDEEEKLRWELHLDREGTPVLVRPRP